MYIAVVLLTMFVLPIGFTLTEHTLAPHAPLVVLAGKWFVFFGVGVRLGVAGLRQFFQPAFTAHDIFHMSGDEGFPVIRELGIANLATAAVALASLAAPSFVLPAAISAALFYGVAGARHLAEPRRGGNQTIAMTSDLFMFAVLAVVVASKLAGIH